MERSMNLNINAKLPNKVLFLLSYTFMTIHYRLKHVPKSFLKFHASALRSFNMQKRATGKDKHFSAADPDAVNRRAFIMSCFGLIHIESIRTGSFGSFANSFPSLTIQLPHESQEIVSGDLFEILKSFIKKPKFHSEASLRYFLWDSALVNLFSNVTVEYEPQMNLKTMDRRYHHLFIDGVFILDDQSDSSNDGKSNIPLLFFEVDKHHLKPNHDHKDVVKIALSMGAALKKLVGLCRYESLHVLKNLFVSGLLIGGSQFDLCFVYTDFGDVEDSDLGMSKPFPPFGMIFKYSRECWRFNIFGDDIVEMNTTESSRFFFMAAGEENYRFEPGHLDGNLRTDDSMLANVDIANMVIAIETEIEYIDVQVKNEDNDQNQIAHSPKQINMQSIQILAQVATMVKNQAKLVDKIIKSRPPLNEKDFETETEAENEKFLFDKKIALHIPSGRKTFASVSTSGTYQGF